MDGMTHIGQKQSYSKYELIERMTIVYVDLNPVRYAYIALVECDCVCYLCRTF